MRKNQMTRISRNRTIRHQSRNHTLRHWVWSILGIVALIVVITGGYMYHTYKHAAQHSYYPTHRVMKRNPQKQIHQKGALSILFLGTDSDSLGSGHTGVTNTMIVNAMNPKTDKSTMVSIPKNVKTSYDGQTMPTDELYKHGGVPAVTKYVQNSMKIPVDYYVLADAKGLAKTAGYVGGIRVTPTQSYTEDGVKFQAGKAQTMGEKDVMAYLKQHGSGDNADYQRQLRNKQVLLALFDKIAHEPMSASAANSLSDDIHTDLSFNDLEKLALHYRGVTQNHQSLSEGANNQSMMNKVTSDPRYQQLSPEQKQKAISIVRQNLGL